MVAKIKIVKSVTKALNYNENKVREGTASLILASRFGCASEDLGFSQKVNRFVRRNALCQKTSNNTLHIFLSFSNQDSLNNEKLQSIASDYMKRIGFGDQPYLVYRHDDTANPHVHIVTTTIKENGKAINLHMIAKRKSEPARLAIEQTFNLIPAQTHKRNQSHTILPGKPQGTKSDIALAISYATRNYRVRNLDELNAILAVKGIFADPGLPGSRRAANNGLLYYKIDREGQKYSVGIKASSIPGEPTLKNLQKLFFKNKLRVAENSKSREMLGDAISNSQNSNLYNLFAELNNQGLQVKFKSEGQNPMSSVALINHASKTIDILYPHQATDQALIEKLGNLTQKVRHPKNTQKNTPLQSSMNSGNVPVLLGNTLLPDNKSEGIALDYSESKKKKRKTP
ncbi:relaxase/mobilization nuclease domain-containing protein [Paraflavitalea sp. CAU 1676]|uniref:relaxase/mobilization nuclease domain-containing protein n=1 Tax=Paraflavitalea sp. CAU 1676 TaxID=3032598 RepID=UPI0023DC13F6|nr:relaxase/mobilization nuclease domain-containing protein [Paraflavitalea sp. CAU 1676]MDF2191358.1 relaxase/mobilization nuclease domain-containing protein [Paraflavitalea sp. CAU 1676]